VSGDLTLPSKRGCDNTAIAKMFKEELNFLLKGRGERQP
jgi:hypothetical protein